MQDPNNFDRFIIVYDKSFATTANMTITTNPIQMENSYHYAKIGLDGLDTHYNSDSGTTVAALQTGGLYLLAFCSSASPVFTINWTSRLYYTDATH